MREESYTITCLIMRAGGPYYGGSGWENDISKACHYSAIYQAETALKALLPKHADATIRCVIQNKFFDYYDGKDFVYSPTGAQLYTFQEAKSELNKLSERKT